jgi:hypothetical protein
MFGKWSVILRVADTQTVYSLVSGEHPEAVFTGSKKQCLKYIRAITQRRNKALGSSRLSPASHAAAAAQLPQLTNQAKRFANYTSLT